MLLLDTAVIGEHWLSIGIDCRERFWSLFPWRYLRTIWAQSRVMCSGDPAWEGGGWSRLPLVDLSSLNQSAILWFCVSVKVKYFFEVPVLFNHQLVKMPFSLQNMLLSFPLSQPFPPHYSINQNPLIFPSPFYCLFAQGVVNLKFK